MEGLQTDIHYTVIIMWTLQLENLFNVISSESVFVHQLFYFVCFNSALFYCMLFNCVLLYMFMIICFYVIVLEKMCLLLLWWLLEMYVNKQHNIYNNVLQTQKIIFCIDFFHSFDSSIQSLDNKQRFDVHFLRISIRCRLSTCLSLFLALHYSRGK